MRTITLTSDFGTRDWFAGTMKGVILSINPGATVVDITHEIPAGDIRAGAFALAASARYFPKGTVHVGVVDPGVGSARAAIAVQTRDSIFIGPDNGVLSWAVAFERIREIRLLENDRYFLAPVSRTFHGRDVFAPIAAHLSRGIPFRRLGPQLKDFCRLPWPKPRVQPGRIDGEIVYIDRFGNGTTNVANDRLPASGRAGVFVNGKRACGLGAFYQSVRAGRAVAVPGSSGFLEIAVSAGSAAETLDLRVGQRVSIR